MRPELRLATALCLLIAAGPSQAIGGFGQIVDGLSRWVREFWEPPAPPPHIPASPRERVRPEEAPRLPALPPLPLNAAKVPSATEAAKDGLEKRITSIFRSQPRLILAPASAKDFGKAFRRGAKNSKEHLSTLGKTNRLVNSWLAAPVQRRIFVVGAAESDPDLRLLRDRLKHQGYEVFFYEFCKEATKTLCASEEVGAFYATAGHAIAFRSPGFAKSSYINVEVASIYQHSEGGVLLVFTPEEVVASSVALTTGAANTVGVMCFDIAPSRDRHKVVDRASPAYTAPNKSCH